MRRTARPGIDTAPKEFSRQRGLQARNRNAPFRRDDPCVRALSRSDGPSFCPTISACGLRGESDGVTLGFRLRQLRLQGREPVDSSRTAAAGTWERLPLPRPVLSRSPLRTQRHRAGERDHVRPPREESQALAAVKCSSMSSKERTRARRSWVGVYSISSSAPVSTAGCARRRATFSGAPTACHVRHNQASGRGPERPHRPAKAGSPPGLSGIPHLSPGQLRDAGPLRWPRRRCRNRDGWPKWRRWRPGLPGPTSVTCLCRRGLLRSDG